MRSKIVITLALFAVLGSPSAWGKGRVPCLDFDFDGYGSPGAAVCSGGPANDCNDQDARIHPGALEVCNGKDDDCNGKTDDVPGLGTSCTAGVGACQATGRMACSLGSLSCDAQPKAPQPEVCGNAVDEDCDGVALPCIPPPPKPVSHRDRHALYPGSWTKGGILTPSNDAQALARLYSHLILGPGLGTNSIEEIYRAAAAQSLPLRVLAYMKSVGLHPTSSGRSNDQIFGYDALLSAGVIARQTYPSGTIVENTFNHWHYVDMVNAGGASHLNLWKQNRVDLFAWIQANTHATEGVYNDNSSVMILGGSNSFTTPAAGPAGYSDRGWYDAVTAVLTAERAAYPTKLIAANSYAGWSTDPTMRGLEFLANIDILVFEGFSWKTDGTSSPAFYDPTRYRQQVADATKALRSFNGKVVFLIDDFLSTAVDRRMFRLGTWLLIWDGSNGLKEVPRVPDTATDVDYCVEHDVVPDHLGRPIGDPVDLGDVIYRDYENGRVWVNPDTSAHNITVPAGWTKAVILGGTAYNDSSAAVTWSPVSGTISLAAHTAMVTRRSAVADQAAVRARWARTIMRSSESCAVEVGVRVENTGDQIWTPNSRRIRTHVCLPDGTTYLRDPATGNSAIAQTVNPGDVVDQAVLVLAEPDTVGLKIAALFHPDTTIVTDVVQEGVAWLGNPQGVIRMSDAFRGGKGAGDFDRAMREGFGANARAAGTASGSDQNLVDLTVPANHTYLLDRIDAVSTGAQAQIFDVRVTPVGSAEQVNPIPVDAKASEQRSLRGTRLLPGDRVKVVLLANGSGGAVNARLAYVDLPWRDDR